MAEIEKSIFVLRRPSTVWEQLASSVHIEKWWGKGVFLDPQPGGKFHEPWQDTSGNHLAVGTVIKCKPNEFIHFTWAEDSWPKGFETSVEIHFIPKFSGTEVTVRHKGWTIFSKDDQSSNIQSFSEGWEYLLSKLKNAAEETHTEDLFDSDELTHPVRWIDPPDGDRTAV